MKFLSALFLAATAWSGLFPGALVGAVKIMPFGDSITELGCWRAMLYQQLQNAGYTNIDFVGSVRSTTNCNIQYDVNNEGHSGYLATNIADQNQLVPWLSATNPEIVTMHLGTNDMWSLKSTQQILAAYTKLVGQMRANNPNMKIIVAKIIPMNMPSCGSCSQGIIALNNAIGPWATQLSTSSSPITVVDQYTGFNAGSDTGDGIHPNASGDQKMTKIWYPAVVAALGSPSSGGPTSTTPTTPPTTSTSTPISSPTSGPAGAAWAQCGGIGWKGATTCVSGYTCKVSNAYYSQCVPA